MNDLLKEAIADAKAVRTTALANAKLALEEAFTPKLQSMLSAKIREEAEYDMDEAMRDDEMEEGEMRDETMREDEHEMDEMEHDMETEGHHEMDEMEHDIADESMRKTSMKWTKWKTIMKCVKTSMKWTKWNTTWKKAE